MVKLTDDNIQKIFGIEDAENEHPERLKEFFFKNKAYDNLKSDLPIRILVGHKGVGKSALLKVAFLEDKEDGILTIWFRPGDLENVTKAGAESLNSMIETWKSCLMDMIFAAIMEQIAPSVEGSSYGPIKANVSSLVTAVRNNITEKAGISKSEIELPWVQNFLRTGKIRVYLDDLDRGWTATHADITRVSALLNAIRDLCGHENNLQFRLGLRSDVYFLVRTSDESTDKTERNLIWLSWENHEILLMFAKRVETFFGRDFDEEKIVRLPQSQIVKYLYPVIVERFEGAGKWENAPIHRVLLSLTRKRPRDLIKLFYGAAREAYRNDREIISTTDLKQTFEVYSGERLQDIVNEFKSELPEVGRLVHGMRPTTKEKRTLTSYSYSNDGLIKKLKNLMQNTRYSFTNGSPVTPNSLAEFLYKIDFITARKRLDNGEIVRKFFDQNRYLKTQFADYGFDWEIHPAYRWALQPEDVDAIFKDLDLSTAFKEI